MCPEKYSVLEDTRNDENPNSCKLCGVPLRVIASLSSERYHICVYECRQCHAGYFTLSQNE